MAPTQSGGSAASSGDASSSKAEVAAPASGDAAAAEGAAAGGRKTPIEKKPPSLKMTLAILFVVFLFMNPGVRWRVQEFHLYCRSHIPYGGNPFLPGHIGGPAADMLIVDATYGTNSELMTGVYLLQKDEKGEPTKVNGRFSWYKNSPGHEAYLIWDECSAWLISRFPTGNSPNCEGWSYTNKCYGAPWECPKLWMLREEGRWDMAGGTVKVTAHHGEVPKAYAPECSVEQEEHLLEQFGNFDIVIPWVNGSDPQWAEDRSVTCEDWQWQEMWADAATRSQVSTDCLKEPESIEEATRLVKQRGCEKGVFGQEGSCVWGKLPEVPRGLTTRSSRCFTRFVHAQCTARMNSIKDHDELRYLVRSIERNLPWHRGRILLITPNKTAPSWLKPGGRLAVIAQEDLLRKAMESTHFVNAADRGRASEWAPGRIFNDYPVESALAFVPKAARVLMLVQDDILFARPTTICDYFLPNPAGLRLFARPFFGVSNKEAEEGRYRRVQDPYDHVYEATEQWTAGVFKDSSAKKDGTASTYYRILHLPQMLDTRLLEDLWKDYPEIMSDAISSSQRHPNLTNTIALHHSEAERRYVAGGRLAAEAAQDDSVEKAKTDLASQINNLVMNMSGAGEVSELPWTEVVFQSLADWHEKMKRLLPDPEKLPGIIGLQDDLSAGMEDDIDELDCLRENWLNELLPGPSSWEDPNAKPSKCTSVKEKAARSAEAAKMEACSLNEVAVTGGEAIQPECMGTFVKTGKTGKDHGSRSIYQNSHGKYLSYRKETGCWLIGDDYKDMGKGVRLQSKKKESAACPTEAIQWEIYDFGWKPSKDIKVVEAPVKKRKKEHPEL